MSALMLWSCKPPLLSLPSQAEVPALSGISLDTLPYDSALAKFSAWRASELYQDLYPRPRYPRAYRASSLLATWGSIPEAASWRSSLLCGQSNCIQSNFLLSTASSHLHPALISAEQLLLSEGIFSISEFAGVCSEAFNLSTLYAPCLEKAP